MVLVSESFREASAIKPVSDLAACLDSINGLACFQRYKEATWEHLNIGSGSRILDVGCGVGYDLIGIAERCPDAVVTGVDVSSAMVELARQRVNPFPNIHLAAANGAVLPFADQTFDGARIDRSLQHAERPDQIIDEMTRVTRSGGVVLAAEPDWGTFILYNGDRETSDRLAREWANSIRNPAIGRTLQSLFVASGMAKPRVRAHPLLLTDSSSADAVYDLDRLLSHCVARNVISAVAAREWRARSERAAEEGCFFSYLCVVEVSGNVP